MTGQTGHEDAERDAAVEIGGTRSVVTLNFGNVGPEYLTSGIPVIVTGQGGPATRRYGESRSFEAAFDETWEMFGALTATG